MLKNKSLRLPMERRPTNYPSESTDGKHVFLPETAHFSNGAWNSFRNTIPSPVQPADKLADPKYSNSASRWYTLHFHFTRLDLEHITKTYGLPTASDSGVQPRLFQNWEFNITHTSPEILHNYTHKQGCWELRWSEWILAGQWGRNAIHTTHHTLTGVRIVWEARTLY